MDTSTFGRSFLPAPDARKARKAKQSLPLFHRLAHCDDITSRDIIIILINAVTQHEELLHLMVENLRTPHIIGEEGNRKQRGRYRESDWAAAGCQQMKMLNEHKQVKSRTF